MRGLQIVMSIAESKWKDKLWSEDLKTLNPWSYVLSRKKCKHGGLVFEKIQYDNQFFFTWGKVFKNPEILNYIRGQWIIISY